MTASSMLVLGSPIKEHLAPSMVGPTAASGAPAAGMLASGSGVATASHLGAGAAAAKTAVLGGLVGSLLYTAALVAAGYAGYRLAKGLFEAVARRTAAG